MRGVGEREAGGDSAGRQARHTPRSRQGPNKDADMTCNSRERPFSVTLRKATGGRAPGRMESFSHDRTLLTTKSYFYLCCQRLHGQANYSPGKKKTHKKKEGREYPFLCVT